MTCCCSSGATLSLLPVFGGFSVPAVCLQLADKRPEVIKPVGQLLRFSLKFIGVKGEIRGAQ